MSYRDIFRFIYFGNLWEGKESISGPGSGLVETEEIRRRIPELIKSLNIQSILDIPCGDFFWFKEIELDAVSYTGADLIGDLIAENQRLYGSDKKQFQKLDILCDALPDAGLILVRDCFPHFSNVHILKATANIKRSKVQYLLSTTFPECAYNEDILTGCWRPLNLCIAPFYYPEPLAIINEGCSASEGAYKDKSLALWRVSDLPETEG